MIRKNKKPPRYRRIAFVVSFDLPKEASVSECREYIKDAVTTWKGQLRPPGGYGKHDPGDPMHELRVESVKVRQYRARKSEVYDDDG